MPLNAPQVGRLSVCSTTVTMQYQIPGARVTLHVDGSPIPLGEATTAWEVMKLPAGLTLPRNALVVATQEFEGETSPPGPAVMVQGLGATASRPQPHPDSHIYECAAFVALAGVTPGASVEIRKGGSVLGTGVAGSGAVVVELNSPVPASEALVARATGCGQQLVSITLPRGDKAPLTAGGMLPAPMFGSPVMACVDSLRIDGVVPGATVILTRGDGSVERHPFATRTWLIRLVRPLELGESLKLRQEFQFCKIVGEDRPERVGPLTVGPPTLTSPWCAGRVTASDLIPGAILTFFAADGTELGRSGVPGTSGQFPMQQPMAFKFFARQEMCGTVSEPSNTVSANTDPDLVDLTPPSPVIVAPVLACQTEVTVRGQVGTGGLVEVLSESRGMIGWRHALTDETIVTVASLLPNERIQARMVSCSLQEASSAFATAQVIPDIPSPRITAPLHAGTKVVRVLDVKIGARLDLYVNDAFKVGVTVTSDPQDVNLPEALVAGQRVNGRQGICDKWLGGEEEPVTAVPAIPPPAASGFGKVVVLNCHTAHRTINVWSLDHTAGTKTRVGSLNPNYDDFGSCPAAGAPMEVKLADGHVHEIVFVDPGALGCEGQDDPMVVACRRDSMAIVGLSTGPAFHWQVS
jgi:hypothetical protein